MKIEETGEYNNPLVITFLVYVKDFESATQKKVIDALANCIMPIDIQN